MPEQYSVEAYLRATDQGFSKAFENAERSVDKMTGTTTKAGGLMSSAIGKITAAAAAIGGVTAFASFGLETVKAAASVQAVRSQFEQAFKGITDAAEGTMKALSEQYNIMPERLRQPMSSLQSYFLGVGMSADKALTTTEQAMRIAANGAAYYDRSIEDVSTSMKSFLMGNYMVGDQFGVNANLTKIATKYNEQYGGSFEDLSEAMKQSYLLEYIQDVYELNGAMADSAGEMDQAEKEAFAYENTLGNFRETWKQLKATIGQNFLPMVISGMETIMNWMERGGEIVTGLKDSLKTLWDTFRNAPLTNNFLQAFGEWSSSARSFFDTVVIPAVDRVKAALTNMFGEGEDNGGIFGTGWNFMDLWWKIQETVNWFNELKAEFMDSTFWTTLTEVMQPVGEWFGTLGDTFAELRAEFAENEFITEVSDAFNAVKDAIFAIDFVKIRDGIQEVITKAGELWDAWTGSTTWTTFKADILDPMVKKFGELKTKFDEWVKAIDEETALAGLKTKLEEIGTAALGIDFGKIKDDFQTFTEKADEWQTKWKPLIDGLTGAAAVFIIVTGVVLAFTAAMSGISALAGILGTLTGVIIAFVTNPLTLLFVGLTAGIALLSWFKTEYDKIIADLEKQGEGFGGGMNDGGFWTGIQNWWDRLWGNGEYGEPSSGGSTISAKIKEDTDAIATQLGTANTTIKPQMDTLASTLTEVDLTTGLGTETEAFQGIMQGVLDSITTMSPEIQAKMDEIYSSFAGASATAGETSGAATAATDVQATWDGILAVVTTSTAAINAAVKTGWETMYTDILTANTLIVALIIADTTTIATTTTAGNAALVMNFTATWAAIVAAVLNAGLVEAVTTVMAQALASATSTAAAFYSVGLAMMQGLANGIYAGQSLVIAAAVSVALAGYVAAQAALAIGSPSKKFEELGYQSMQGLALGIIRNASDPLTAIKAVAKAMVNTWSKDGLNVRNADVNQRVEHIISENMTTAKPAVIRLAMGNNTYGAYVEDITGRQSHTATLERRYLR
jgi:hypothetical protein